MFLLKQKNNIYKVIICCVVLLFGITAKGQDSEQYPFYNPDFSVEERVEDIISRLTLEEKVQQLMHETPAIERLDIPSYDWWNECLHGVARTDYNTTVFPQAIAMAATFDKEALETMADFTAMEGRAIYNDASSKGNYGRYYGLTYWSPNINIFRDPRWGRGHETYGEDPYLTGILGKAFVKGMQGEDPNHYKVSACAKHYAVHSGPEPLRHTFDITVSDYDLWDTYLPAFYDLVVEANVSSVMCAYNAYSGKPCCGNNFLMRYILRDKWHFDGYVVADCGAVDDFWLNHRTHPDKATAAADAIKNGTDVECTFQYTYAALEEAIDRGLVSEEELDESLRRLFSTRIKLGLFDPAEERPYHDITIDVLEQDTHKAQALKMAHESIVLLKNDNSTLPLSKNIKKIAVIGPNANDEIAPLANYNGTPSEVVTPYEGIKAKVGDNVEVYLEQGITHTDNKFFIPINISDCFTFGDESGFQAEYFTNLNFEGKPQVTKKEDRISKFWREGSEIANGVFANTSSVRWTSTFIPKNDEDYSFEIAGNNGFRMKIDDKLCINSWEKSADGHGYAGGRYVLKAEKGKKYEVVIEYRVEGGSFITFKAGNDKVTDLGQFASRVKDADAIVFVGGLTPELEGEEMLPTDFVEVEGFNGGDRTTINLPKVQSDLLKELYKTGKPVVFVMMTGSAIACQWEADNIPAIVNAWYGGQAAGTALADVLFGDYNPSGKLPVTFYSSDADLPDFEDYSMNNRTYRYFKGKPLWGFGHGLSYTTFKFENLELPEESTTGKTITVKVKVTNTGNYDGEEVAQLYLKHLNAPGYLPLRSLKGFERVSLKAGESKTVEFLLSPKELAYVNDKGDLAVYPGDVMVSVGGTQPDATALANNEAVQKTINIVGNKVLLSKNDVSKTK